jgi:hypothetical protein
MGKWLAAYREGQWKEKTEGVPAPKAVQAALWRSPRFGSCTGRIVLSPEDGWVLVQGEHTPDLLVWVREDLLNAAR